MLGGRLELKRCWSGAFALSGPTVAMVFSDIKMPVRVSAAGDFVTVRHGGRAINGPLLVAGAERSGLPGQH
jgi:hypothetical protein